MIRRLTRALHDRNEEPLASNNQRLEEVHGAVANWAADGSNVEWHDAYLTRDFPFGLTEQ